MIISAYVWATDSSHGCPSVELVLPWKDYCKDTEQNGMEKPGCSLLPNSWQEDEGQMMGRGLGMASRRGERGDFSRWGFNSCFGNLLRFLMASVMNLLGYNQSPTQTDPRCPRSAFSSPVSQAKCCFVMKTAVLGFRGIPCQGK